MHMRKIAIRNNTSSARFASLEAERKSVEKKKRIRAA